MTKNALPFVNGRAYSGDGKHSHATFQHRLVPGSHHLTVCGMDVSGWSRVYSRTASSVTICRRSCKHGPGITN